MNYLKYGYPSNLQHATKQMKTLFFILLTFYILIIFYSFLMDTRITEGGKAGTFVLLHRGNKFVKDKTTDLCIYLHCGFRGCGSRLRVRRLDFSTWTQGQGNDCEVPPIVILSLKIRSYRNESAKCKKMIIITSPPNCSGPLLYR